MNTFYKDLVANLVTMRLTASFVADQVRQIPGRADLLDQVEALQADLVALELQVRVEAVHCEVVEGLDREAGYQAKPPASVPVSPVWKVPTRRAS